MAIPKRPYKGTRDLFPELKRTQDYLFQKMRHVAELFGHEPYDGPLLEEVELYKAKSGEELINEQIYSFVDRGKRFVAIRPEMTPTLARMVAQVHRELPKPLRWYSIPNLMRYERPQKGRLREHWQFNCDIFGAPPLSGELEILQLAILLFESFGANESHFEIRINDRQVVDNIFYNLLKLDEARAYQLYKLVDRAKKITPEELHQSLSDLSLGEAAQQAFLEYLELSSFEDLFSFLEKYHIKESAENSEASFSHFIQSLRQLGLLKYVHYDPAVVRGLDYYTGLVFEIFDKHPENRRALCGGGSYANLLKIFDEPALPGIGFGLGDVTLKDFLSVHGLLPDFSNPQTDLLLTFQTEAAHNIVLQLAQDLRKMGLKVTTHPMVLNFKKAFPLAEKRGAKFMAFIGDDEMSREGAQLKNLETKEQVFLSRSDLDAWKKTIETSKKGE